MSVFRFNHKKISSTILLFGGVFLVAFICFQRSVMEEVGDVYQTSTSMPDLNEDLHTQLSSAVSIRGAVNFIEVEYETVEVVSDFDDEVSQNELVDRFIELGATHGLGVLNVAEFGQLPSWLARLAVLKGWSERYPLAALTGLDGLSPEDVHIVVSHAWPTWFRAEPQGALQWLDDQTDPERICLGYEVLALSLTPQQGSSVMDIILERRDPGMAYSQWAETWAGMAPELAIPLVQVMADDLGQSDLVDYFLSVWSEHDEQSTYAWMDAHQWPESD